MGILTGFCHTTSFLLRQLCAWMLLCALTPAALHAQEGGGGEDEPTLEEAPGLPVISRPQAGPQAAEEEAEEDPDGIRVERVQEVEDAEVQRRVRQYVESSQGKITVYQVVAEMIDDLTADLTQVNVAAVSPIALRGVALSPNLSSAFGDWVSAELITTLAKHTDIRVKRCVSCQALRTRMEGEEWVVTLGHVTQQELAEEAKRLGVNAYMDATLAYVPGANIVSMNVQVYRAEDGKILWTETYQSDATTAAVLRSGDRVLTRAEARAELVRKIEQRPYYGYQLLAGAGLIPYDSPTASSLTGFMIGGRLYEKFGQDKRYLYGFHGESFINLSDENSILGAFLGVIMQYELGEPNLNSPTYRVGGIVEGFVAGTEGNSFALEANFETILQFRYGASIGAFYFFPTTFAGSDLGGPGLKARFVINW